MAIQFHTEQYEFAHGHKPRGTGMWAFYLGERGRWLADPVFTPAQMTFTAAKKWAAARARAEGCTQVSVGS